MKTEVEREREKNKELNRATKEKSKIQIRIHTLMYLPQLHRHMNIKYIEITADNTKRNETTKKHNTKQTICVQRQVTNRADSMEVNSNSSSSRHNHRPIESNNEQQQQQQYKKK